MALKSMKMQWTLNDFISLDEQFVYKIKSCDTSFCTKVTMDEACVDNFIRFMQVFDFKRTRVGYLYGNFGEDNTVNVEVYENFMKLGIFILFIFRFYVLFLELYYSRVESMYDHFFKPMYFCSVCMNLTKRTQR